MEEIWKDIPSQPNYEASNLGRIRNKEKLNIKCQYLCQSGYYYVSLPNNVSSRKSRNGAYQVHQLVAEAFLGKCPERKVVDHIDGVRSNNAVSNLRYVTSSENNRRKKDLQRRRFILCAEYLDELFMEFDSTNIEILNRFPKINKAIIPVERDGMWACRTYE